MWPQVETVSLIDSGDSGDESGDDIELEPKRAQGAANADAAGKHDGRAGAAKEHAAGGAAGSMHGGDAAAVEPQPQPCILFLDSLNCHRKAEVTKQIRTYVVVLGWPPRSAHHPHHVALTRAGAADSSDLNDGSGCTLVVSGQQRCSCCRCRPRCFVSRPRYLGKEYAARKLPAGTTSLKINKKSLPDLQCKVPQQDNSCDCGVFVLK